MKLLIINLVFIIAVFQVVSGEYFESDYYDETMDFFSNLNMQDDYNYDTFFSASSRSGSKNSSDGNCEKCGIVNVENFDVGRIINGKPVKPLYKYPWIVSLIFKDKIKCGGALISSTAVLTAAHCVYNKQKSQTKPKCKGLKVDESCFFSPNEFKLGLLSEQQETPSKTKTMAVKKVIAHPKYSFTLKINDIAILQLAKTVKCGTLTSPVCLPTKDDLKSGTKLVVAGYGKNASDGTTGPQILREGSMKVVGNKNCLRKIQPKDTSDNVVCASATASKQKACFGDSGSALFGKFNNKMYAVGIVSSGKGGKCETSSPTTHSKIHSAMPFIKQHVKDLPEDPGESPTSTPKYYSYEMY